eukprot:4821154-Pyramimonas_sp.AAC.2
MRVSLGDDVEQSEPRPSDHVDQSEPRPSDHVDRLRGFAHDRCSKRVSCSGALRCLRGRRRRGRRGSRGAGEILAAAG